MVTPTFDHIDPGPDAVQRLPKMGELRACLESQSRRECPPTGGRGGGPDVVTHRSQATGRCRLEKQVSIYSFPDHWNGARFVLSVLLSTGVFAHGHLP